MNAGPIRPDRTSLLWAGGILVTTALFSLVLVRPQFSRLADLYAQIAQTNETLATTENCIEEATLLHKEIRGLTKETANFDALVPIKANQGLLLQNLDHLAQTHNLRPESIQPGKPTRYAKVSSLPIRVRLSGAFEDVYGMIHDATHMDRIVHSERFLISAMEEQPGTVLADIDFIVYFRGP